MDRMWAEATAANPTLFDGPVVVCADLSRHGANDLVLTWYRATYRLYILRSDAEYGVRAPSVFVSVAQSTHDGRLLVGRMASHTSTPGRWQLPGGTMEPPPYGALLDTDGLRRHAARELAEEVGLAVPADELKLWAVTRSNLGNVGFHFWAAPSTPEVIQGRYEALVRAELAEGGLPELDRLRLIRCQSDLPDLGSSVADYLQVLVGPDPANDDGPTAPGVAMGVRLPPRAARFPADSPASPG
ncbi:NUDIX hydrolase [Streptomyces sp. NPDC092307]|uniref:NUDIX hydrolase n=1 Tax=Streptomyces sp. NPDC092307 TaxID=3366013 RepID=UPI00382638EA